MTPLARALFVLARFLAPEDRKRWIEAMAAELGEVPSHRKLPFAWGAVEFSLTTQMEDMMNNTVKAGSFALMLVSAFLAFVGLANAVRNFALDPALGVAFGLMGALWLAAFVSAMLRRWDVLSRIASGGLAAAVALGVAWSMSVPALAANRSVFGALALEAVILFAVLLAAGALVRKLAVSRA